jgi:hypothetical protein
VAFLEQGSHAEAASPPTLAKHKQGITLSERSILKVYSTIAFEAQHRSKTIEDGKER